MNTLQQKERIPASAVAMLTATAIIRVIILAALITAGLYFTVPAVKEAILDTWDTIRNFF